MHTEPSDHGPGGSRTLERAIVLVLLGQDAERAWSLAELGDGLGVAQAELASALSGLIEAGVLEQRADRVWPSSAARRLDELELIGI
jgi:DNA-binding IclR family transcriptional regulator